MSIRDINEIVGIILTPCCITSILIFKNNVRLCNFVKLKIAVLERTLNGA